MYDTVIQHGDGDDPDSFYALIKRTNKKAGGSPKDGIDEKKWLNKFLDVRYDDLMNPANHDTRDEWRESVARVDVLRSIAKEYGIRSERQLEKEIYYNMTYRWFLGLNIRVSLQSGYQRCWYLFICSKKYSIFSIMIRSCLRQMP